VLLLAGAFIMPGEKAFQSIHSMPLLEWMREQPVKSTWWLWASMGLLIVLSANTLLCSIDSIAKKRKVTQWMLLISPQIVHIGFLFMLIAHLASAVGGFKTFAVAAEGTPLEMPENSVLQIKRIAMSFDSYGYLYDWAVDVEYWDNGQVLKKDRLLPNKPVFLKGVGVYVKDLRAFPNKMVLLEVSREPGAIWALVGSILFMTGTIALLVLKMKREDTQTQP
jgi:cytochrome c biogenesis protein ResB